MLPKRGEWASWSARERVGYIAELAVPVALLATVIFSYLSWSEARRSVELTQASLRQEQSFFVAQNPPDMELTGLHVVKSDIGPILFFSLKNTGDAALRSPCTEISRVDGDAGSASIISTNCETHDAYENAVLRKGEGVTYHIPVKGYFEFTPSEWKILKPEDATTFGCKSKRGDSLLVRLAFKDILGERYSKTRQVILCA